jgi:hypothetical protein
MLRNIADEVAGPLRGLAKNPNLASQGVEEAENDLKKCGLATPIGADHAQEISLLNGEGDILKHKRAIISKIHVRDLDNRSLFVHCIAFARASAIFLMFLR